MLVSAPQRDASAGRAHHKSVLDQIRFPDILDRPGVFADRSRQSFQSHRPSSETDDHGLQDLSVKHLKTVLVHIEKIKGVSGDFAGDHTVVAHLGEISDSLKEPVRESGRSSGALGQLLRTIIVYLYVQQFCGSRDGL